MELRDRPTGRTSLPRLAAVLVATAVAGAVVLGGIAEGVIGVSFTSGSPFTVTVDRVESDGLRIVPGASSGDPGVPTLLARLPTAELSGLCQSVTVDLPVVGRVTTVLRAPHVRTTDLVLEVRGITGGLDVGRLRLGPVADAGGTPGYQAGRTTLTDLRITAGTVTAGTFTVADLDLSHHKGDEGCPSTQDGQGR
ncbi:DUF6230 family protein [Actinosynnema sp. NPDC002837]